MERRAADIEVEVGGLLPPADATFAEMVGSELPRLQRIARLQLFNGAGKVFQLAHAPPVLEPLRDHSAKRERWS